MTLIMVEILLFIPFISVPFRKLYRPSLGTAVTRVKNR